MFSVFNLKKDETLKKDKNQKNLILYNNNNNNCKSNKVGFESARGSENLNLISTLKKSERKRKNCFNYNQVLLNDKRFTPKISDKSNQKFRLEGTEKFLYNDAKKRQQKKIEIELINSSPKIKFIKKFSRKMKNEELILKKFAREFNTTIKELKIDSYNLDKFQLKAVLDHLGILDCSSTSEALFEETWKLLNRSNHVSSSNLLEFFAIVIGLKSKKAVKVDSKLFEYSYSLNNENFGKLDEKGESITTVNEGKRVKKIFKKFLQNYLRKSKHSKKCQINYPLSLNLDECLKSKKKLFSSSFKLLESSKKMKQKNINNLFQNSIYSTWKEFRKEKAISTKSLKSNLNGSLFNNNRNIEIKIHPLKENIDKIENQKTSLNSRIKNKQESNVLPKKNSQKLECAKKLFNTEMKLVDEYKTKCPFKPSINNYKKQHCITTLPKNATYEIERMRKAYEEKERVKKGIERIEGSTTFKTGKGWNSISKLKGSKKQKQCDLMKNDIKTNNR